MAKMMLTADHTFAQPTSLLVAAEEQGLMFETKTSPIILPNGETSSEFHFLYRELADGTQVILNNDCSSEYGGQLAYRLDFALMEDIFPNTCVGLQAWGHGREVLASHDLGGGHTFGDGDSLSQYMLYVLGLNGKRKLRCAITPRRGFCENQLPSSTSVIDLKRTKLHGARMVAREEALQQANLAFQAQVLEIERRKLTTLSAAQVDAIFSEIVKLNTNTGEELTQQKRIDEREAAIRSLLNAEVAAFGRNAESLYQAVHTYEHHRVDAHDRMGQVMDRTGLPLSQLVLQKVAALV